ncbi:hypothetical protein [Pseudoalteromonas sp. TAB23]|uniref:hypothetical protein n=1 Tax=Pseudoalteromonas sp. TAB23 TaxID=1938595 RepID=UPI000408C685|nr:hypothetical protein [Pseudoalteromonas sp. TAB23]
MNAVTKINPLDIIDVQNLASFDAGHLQDVIDLFKVGVAEFRLVIEAKKVIAHLPCSQGKDSTVTLLIALEAYRQSIEAGKIERDRPLIVSTVNTKAESIPMNLYVSYAKKRVEAYAAKNNINLHYDIVSPPLNDEYFIKYAGGNKLIVNPKRHGDCSIILKVTPSERYVKQLIESFKQSTTMADYAGYSILSCVGSRSGEGGRRSANMSKQNIKHKSIGDILKEIEEVSVTSRDTTFLKYAPIRHWSTDSVFDALRLAGDKPLTKAPKNQKNVIPAFLPDFGLLIEIYGQGSMETCSVIVGDKGGSGCNGKARYGCSICTMISAKDKSSTALSKYKRWDSLGVTNALRVRDFMYRLSESYEARALHARSVDSVAYSRVGLQPNILKPKYLEKLVRYASQLTLDSIKISNEFRELVKADRVIDHPGYREIAEDSSLPPKTKKAFLEMYVEGVQDPKNLNYLFSEAHALLLSFRWAIDGIGAAPYRPLAIWDNLKRGIGRIPYPKLNSELIDNYGGIQLENISKLPEALMVKTLKDEDPVKQAESPASLLSLWERPLNGADIFEEDMNCSLTRVSNNNTDILITYEQSYTISGYSVAPKQPSIKSIKIAGKLVEDTIKDTLVYSGVMEQLEQVFDDKVEYITKKHLGNPASEHQAFRDDIKKAFSGELTARRSINYLSEKALFGGFSQSRRKTTPRTQFTRRVTSIKRGKVIKGNTRLAFYPPHFDSALYSSHIEKKLMLIPNFDTHTEVSVGTHLDSSELNLSLEDIENIEVDSHKYILWCDLGGREKALKIHDEYLARKIKKRHLLKLSKYDVRDYGGESVPNQMLADGVITIAKKYWKQLHAILKRTQIFNSLGLYSFQSVPYSVLANDPRFIKMNEHRKDKAKLLMVVRNRRNEQRKSVRKFLSKSQGQCCDSLLVLLKQNLDVLYKESKRAIYIITNQNFSHLFKVRFHSHEVSNQEQVDTCKLWLKLTYGKNMTVDSIMETCLPTKQARLVRNNPKAKIKAAQLISEFLSDIANTAKSTQSFWCDYVEEVKAILSNDNDQLNNFKRLTKERLKMYESDDVLRYWNPGETHLVDQLNKAINKYNAISSYVYDLQVSLMELNASAMSSTIGNMSLSDKLAFLTSGNS